MSKMWLGLPRKIVPNLIDTTARSIPDLFRFSFLSFFLYRSLSNIPSSIPFQKNRITRFSNRRQPQWRSTQCLARVFVSLFRDHDDDVYINLTSSCVVKDGSFATWINYFASRYLDILCRVREFSFNLILSDEMAKKKKKNGKRSFFFFSNRQATSVDKRWEDSLLGLLYSHVPETVDVQQIV